MVRILRRTKRFNSSRRINGLSSVFRQDELDDEPKDAVQQTARSRSDALDVWSIKTPITRELDTSPDFCRNYGTETQDDGVLKTADDPTSLNIAG